MTHLATHHHATTAIVLPTPRVSVSTRLAKPADLPFIDSLQKMHSHMVGWMPMKSLEGHLEKGRILIAEESGGHGLGGQALGYCLSADQYMKRDDVGIIYQLNVAPLKQRNLIGATLVKAVFERAAYGCRLFGCWCAQDIQANWFWESIGFVPLAFRTGSRAKQRIHIYWQRRIREGDDSTPYWFPSQTTGGALAEDRIVLPIPPDTHWRDAKPLVLPGIAVEPEKPATRLTLPGGAPVKPRPEQPKLTAAQKAAVHRMHSKHLQGVPLGKKAVLTASGIKYVERGDYVAEADVDGTPEELEALDIAEGRKPSKARKDSKGPRAPRAPRAKNDPKYIAAARELRDRFLDQVNAGLILPGGEAGQNARKYEVSRPPQLPAGGSMSAAPTPLEAVPPPRLLDAA